MKNLKTTNHSPLIAILFAFSSVFAISGCGEATASMDKEEEEKKEIVKVPVEATKITRGQIANYYAANAILESINEADVIAKVQGLIEQVLVEEGDYVEQGQVLATIDATRYQLVLDQRRAELKQVKSEYDRLNSTKNKGLVSADQLEKLQWQYKSLEAATSIAELDVAEANVVAPISGFISARYVKKGNLVQQYQHENLFHIVSQRELQGVLHLPEGQFSNVKKGQNVNLSVPAVNNQQFVAKVERISPVIDAKSGTFKVVITMDNQKLLLNSGMFAEVKLEYGVHRNALLAPSNSILTMDNQSIAYIVSENKAIKTEVVIGYRENGFVEILSGLDDNAFLITAGHNNLKDQADVNVINNI
ncbi:efflux RND transporter periplasmic adaptor subunit [Psychrosphaera sp. 1_MG-2023]|uniref:efflux RND transporter periplasmic adaptor subunit n=1 Tax=Psychrosphaera sp. 1_MG-2023 TaxID=3062643 RepID=UPI0026E2F24F|nr:efflux RND transporter periplasmic adaptor subunit [Psychrosphaera sp. 1_MG-2023]MDO6717852.1 efflux RND transporter periplasmic adaptor subunit [Psychrosphaera sp. 1_MG-2023]